LPRSDGAAAHRVLLGAVGGLGCESVRTHTNFSHPSQFLSFSPFKKSRCHLFNNIYMPTSADRTRDIQLRVISNIHEHGKSSNSSCQPNTPSHAVGWLHETTTSAVPVPLHTSSCPKSFLSQHHVLRLAGASGQPCRQTAGFCQRTASVGWHGDGAEKQSGLYCTGSCKCARRRKCLSLSEFLFQLFFDVQLTKGISSLTDASEVLKGNG